MIKFDFDNPTIASAESLAKFTVNDVKGLCHKDGKTWVCTAYVSDEEQVIVCAMSYGKNPKKVLREVMTNGINRMLESEV